MRDWVTCVEACVSEREEVFMLTMLFVRLDSTKSAQSVRRNPAQIQQSTMNIEQVKEVRIDANIIGSAVVAGFQTAFIIFLRVKVRMEAIKDWYKGMVERGMISEKFVDSSQIRVRIDRMVDQWLGFMDRNSSSFNAFSLFSAVANLLALCMYI